MHPLTTILISPTVALDGALAKRLSRPAAAHTEQGRERLSVPTSVIPAEVILIRVGTLPRSSSLRRTDSPLDSIPDRSGSSNASARSELRDLNVYVLFCAAVADLPAVGVSHARGLDGRRPSDDLWSTGHAQRMAPPGTRSPGPLASIRGATLDTCRARCATGRSLNVSLGAPRWARGSTQSKERVTAFFHMA